MLNFYIYKFGEFLALLLPWKAAYGLARFFAFLQYKFSKKDREAVISNLKIILPSLREHEIREKAKAVFINFALYLVEFFRFASIDKGFVKEHFIIENKEILEGALKREKGVILVTAHIGNWELGGMALAILGYPIVAIALDHQNKKVNEFFKRRRLSKGMEVISLGMAAKHCIIALRKNKIVAILGDRDFSNTGYSLDFLGRQKIIPRGPAVLGIRTGSPIIPAMVIRERGNNFSVKLFPIIETVNETDELNIMRKFSKVIEEEIYKYPDQWLMFREFWKE